MGVKTRQLSNSQFEKLSDTIVEWQSVHVADGSTALSATAGKGYFIDTTSAAQTVTFPTSGNTLGDTIILKDYARTFGTNNVTISANNFDGQNGTHLISTSGQVQIYVYTGTTKGWSLISDDTVQKMGPAYIEATGGTVTTTGNFKVHTFTGDGCFVVSSLGTGIPSDQANKVDYLVVAGGAGGGGTGPSHTGAGGGAGGYRESAGTVHGPYTVSPLGSCVGAMPVTTQTYPITVGGGGAKGGEVPRGGSGSNSVFSTITSAGGGGGGSIGSPPTPAPRSGGNGGSGGGGSSQTAGTGGSGNTPPVSPPQGNNGAQGVDAPPDFRGGGGGGATAAGTQGQNSPFIQGAGGAGATSCITGSPVTRAGGGGSGGSYATPNPGLPGAGGSGGGGAGGSAPGVASRLGGDGTANTGGGGGGAAGGNPATGEGGARCGGAGGKGIVIIRYKFQG